MGYLGDIERETIDNENFRKVLFTGRYSQLVVMSLKPGEEIGEEIHNNVDQFIRVEEGAGLAVIDGEENVIEEEYAIVVPAGAMHNIINTSETEELKLYTVYSPPEHKDGTIHRTKKEAEADEHDHA